jgi:rhombotail lipoprotein
MKVAIYATRRVDCLPNTDAHNGRIGVSKWQRASEEIGVAAEGLSGCVNLTCTRSLVLRAGGTDTRHGTATLISSDRETREAASAAYGAATGQMIEHFDAALTKFEADVRSGKAPVQVVRKNDSGHASGGGAIGGSGAMNWPSVLALLMLVTLRRFRAS